MFSIILIVGAAHGLFLVLVLLNICQGNALGQRFLAALTLVFVIDLFYEFLYQTEYFREVSFLLGLDEPLDFLYGPLIYFYVQTLTCPAATQSSGKLGLHVLPCLFAYVLELPFLMIDADQKLTVVYDEVEFDSPRMELVESLVDISTLISIIQIGVYLALSLRILGLYVCSIRARFSYLDRINLVWLRSLFIFLFSLYLLYLTDMFLSDFFGFDEELNNMLFLLMIVMIYTMGYLGLRQPAIVSPLSQCPERQSKNNEIHAETSDSELSKQSKLKYIKSALNGELSATLLAELTAFMKSEKPYLEVGLTLPQLAGRLGISPNYLSQVINEQIDRNFFDFVNHYRFEEAKCLLSDPHKSQANILKLALDAGFNSKSAFYTAFKKHTNMTPSEFKKSLACTTPL